jgi:hypothetical protein
MIETKNTGYWSVSGIQFSNKIQAILYAQEKNLGFDDLQYHYNDPQWDQLDWTQNPKGSIDDWYVKRAQQLREKYDTLILRFSGGADSTNILRTFIDNNIKIDVVSINMWYQEGVDPWIQPSNIEKRDIAIPLIKQLQDQGADFELIISDFSSTLDVINNDPEWFLHVDAPSFTNVNICLHRALTTPEYAKWNKPGTCVITGVDKPHVWYSDSTSWYFSIPDTHCHRMDNNLNLMSQEPFYWTADMPEIVIKQSHIVRQYYQNNIDRLSVNTDVPGIVGTTKKRHVIPLIYPKYYGWFEPSGEPLPYFDMTQMAMAVKKAKYAPRGTGIDFALEKMPQYHVWKTGVELADTMIDSGFKIQNSIFDAGVRVCYTKPRYLD